MRLVTSVLSSYSGLNLWEFFLLVGVPAYSFSSMLESTEYITTQLSNSDEAFLMALAADGFSMDIIARITAFIVGMVLAFLIAILTMLGLFESKLEDDVRPIVDKERRVPRAEKAKKTRQSRSVPRRSPRLPKR